MSQNLTRTKVQAPVGGDADLSLHRAVEILLAHRRGAAIRDIDPALDCEQIRAVVDLAAYYFGETERTRLQPVGVGPCSRRSSRSAIMEEVAGVGC